MLDLDKEIEEVTDERKCLMCMTMLTSFKELMKHCRTECIHAGKIPYSSQAFMGTTMLRS